MTASSSGPEPVLRRFLTQIYQRGVITAATAYLVSAWALAKIGELASDRFAAPDWAMQGVLVALAVGFPLVLLLSWVYDFKAMKLSAEEADEDIARVGASLAAHTSIERKADKNSIAVLPFANMSTDPENEFFADGLAEELLNLLAKINKLKVTARTSSFAFKAKNEDVRDIAKQLNVAHVLEGSVRKSEAAVRITAQLIRAEDGFHIWSETYDRLLNDIFAVQDEIAEAITSVLKIQILGEVPKSEHTDPVAYALYLKGNQLSGNRSMENMKQAEQSYRQSLALAPDFAPAIEGLAVCNSFLMSALELPQEPGIADTRALIDRALEISPGTASILALSSCFAIVFESNSHRALAEAEQAYAAGSGDVNVLKRVQIAFDFAGQAERAVQVARKALELDPLGAPSAFNLGSALLAAGELEEAHKTVCTALNRYPDTAFYSAFLATISLLQGNYRRAFEEVAKEPDQFRREEVIIMLHYATGETAKADEELEQFSRHYGDDALFNRARIHAIAGSLDAAFEYLFRAIEAKDQGTATALADFVLKPLHADPRWVDFLQKAGLPTE